MKDLFQVFFTEASWKAKKKSFYHSLGISMNRHFVIQHFLFTLILFLTFHEVSAKFVVDFSWSFSNKNGRNLSIQYSNFFLSPGSHMEEQKSGKPCKLKIAMIFKQPWILLHNMKQKFPLQSLSSWLYVVLIFWLCLPLKSKG